MRCRKLILAGAAFTKAVPDFRYVSLETPAYLSTVEIPDLGNNPPNTVVKYRALKAMAIDSHDHEKEIEFFGYEIKAKRDVEVFGVKKWPGYLYGYFSNFGQSLFRPFALWFITKANVLAIAQSHSRYVSI